MATTIVTKKINNVLISFEDEIVSKHFEPIVMEIVDAFNKRLEITLDCLWIDVGKNIYNIHIEINSRKDNVDFEDIYLDISQDKTNLIGCAISKGIDLKKNFNTEIVTKMINAINSVNKERGSNV
ncbi:hypothetical protein CP985_14185 [Malaciobacter mytili LMG 24559]|uniref:Uncharacterized protein n=1 Tax=Malaciobacter mytili LMG 24559 TaxID=1032238 RepID=A0AAX2ABR1_9BACT|nr:hypothetical protein [Malaciobacter mytili]AXH16340.1 hypothetical protein AMYT_a0040 [Malaciobacter mytili LMG 24559]RXK12862.1 hypothetical protein CP985_14185 [Malaciobacter mytili LMG 24559]